MDRVEAHLRASSWYEALLTATSTIDKLMRQKKYEEAFIFATNALHMLAAYKCPNADEYTSLVVKVITCLAKQKNQVVVLDGLRLTFEALTAIQLTGMDQLGIAVETWFSNTGIPIGPDLLSWVAPYLPADRQYATAARGCYLNPLMMKTEDAFCLYVLHSLAAGNLRLAKMVTEAYSGDRGALSDVADLSVMVAQKQSLKGIKLIKTRGRDVLTQDMRTLLGTIQLKFCPAADTEEELD